ncbi:MAG: ROK family protein [Mycobacterium sp.]|nr:ROK family protein [Mycobacterium sp.]
MTALLGTDVRVGIDLGGTGTRALAVVNGAVVGAKDCLTAVLAEGSVPARMDRLAEMVRNVIPNGGTLVAVGMGASGPVDVHTGIIYNDATLSWFSGFPLVRGLESRLGVPVAIENDAVAAALGEYCGGAGSGCDRLLMVTLGTGVGVAMLLDGRPWRGVNSAHPEGGHIPVGDDGICCYCGLTGCWEQQASRHTLQRMVGDVLGSRPSSSGLLTEAARAAPNDRRLEEAFFTYGRAVGRGLVTLHTLYQPRTTVIGGSAATCFTLFEHGIREALRRAPEFEVDVDLRPAALGDSAGAIGAAVMLPAGSELLPSPHAKG